MLLRKMFSTFHVHKTKSFSGGSKRYLSIDTQCILRDGLKKFSPYTKVVLFKGLLYCCFGIMIIFLNGVCYTYLAMFYRPQKVNLVFPNFLLFTNETRMNLI